MKKSTRLLVMLCLAAGAFAATAQNAPPPGFSGQMPEGARGPMRDWREMPPEQREQWREERRQRRDAWREMSPEERHQLRRDIRDAGKFYPPAPHGRGPRRD